MRNAPLAALFICILTSGTAFGQPKEGRPPASEPADWSTVCPRWVQAPAPKWTTPYQGRFGLPDPYPKMKEPIGAVTAGIDLWQANHFIVYRSETAKYLYSDYTPLTTAYRRGTLPALEKMVARYAPDAMPPRARAIALLTKAMPKTILHPSIPPLARHCAFDRNLPDERLAASKTGWCNEQARIFVRLCQIAGIPARMVFLFYSNKTGGHVVSEFYADGHWSMADSSWCCVFPDEDGHLMSAAECHEEGARKLRAGTAYHQRIKVVLTGTDEWLVGESFADMTDPEKRKAKILEAAEVSRKSLSPRTPEQLGGELWQFGLLNYPLPD